MSTICLVYYKLDQGINLLLLLLILNFLRLSMAVLATCTKTTETIDPIAPTWSWMPLVAFPVVIFSFLADPLEMNSSTIYSILTERKLVKKADFPTHFQF